MADPTALYQSLRAIAEQVADDMSERDVENLFLEQGFYDALDYEGTGSDIRSEQTLPDNRRPDYITLDGNERVTAVYEFKTSGAISTLTPSSCLDTWWNCGPSTASSRTANVSNCTGADKTAP